MLKFLVAISIFAHYCNAQSFDCKIAKTPSEKAICASDELKILDAKLGAVYKERLSRNDDKDILKNGQREWLKASAKCKADVTCLKASYENRLKDLSRAGNETFGSSTKTFACQKNGSTVHLSVPIFAGTDSLRVKQANDFIRERFGPLKADCSDEGTTSSTEVTVEKITPKAVLLSEYSEWEGGVHPDSRSKSYLLVGAKEFDVGNGLSKAKYGQLLRELSKKATAEAKADAKANHLSASDSCVDAYTNIDPVIDHGFGFRDGHFILSIAFAHVMAACNYDFAIPKEKFLKDYVDQGTMREALATF